MRYNLFIFARIWKGCCYVRKSVYILCISSIKQKNLSSTLFLKWIWSTVVQPLFSGKYDGFSIIVLGFLKWIISGICSSLATVKFKIFPTGKLTIKYHFCPLNYKCIQYKYLYFKLPFNRVYQKSFMFLIVFAKF